MCFLLAVWSHHQQKCRWLGLGLPARACNFPFFALATPHRIRHASCKLAPPLLSRNGIKCLGELSSSRPIHSSTALEFLKCRQNLVASLVALIVRRIWRHSLLGSANWHKFCTYFCLLLKLTYLPEQDWWFLESGSEIALPKVEGCFVQLSTEACLGAMRILLRTCLANLKIWIRKWSKLKARFFYRAFRRREHEHSDKPEQKGCKRCKRW